MTEERRIKLFLASAKSDVTKREYLKNLDRFRRFAKIKKYSELLKLKEKKLRLFGRIDVKIQYKIN